MISIYLALTNVSGNSKKYLKSLQLSIRKHLLRGFNPKRNLSTKGKPAKFIQSKILLTTSAVQGYVCYPYNNCFEIV